MEFFNSGPKAAVAITTDNAQNDRSSGGHHAVLHAQNDG